MPHLSSTVLPVVPQSPGMVWCLALLVAAGCGQAAPAPAASSKTLPTREAVVLTVQPESWPRIVRSQGALVADEVALVGAQVAGNVAEVHVELGDLVRAGEPLVALDQDEFRLQVDQAEAQLAQARSAVGLKADQSLDALDPLNSPPVRQERALWNEAQANLERAKELQTQQVMAQAEFDQIVAAERVAEARYAGAINGVQEKIALIRVRQVELALAQERLRNAVVTAPFDGLVQQRHAAPGGYVQVGDPIVTLVRTNPLRFRGSVPERHAQHLAVSQQVRLRIEGMAEPRVVQVTRISPALDQASRSLTFEAEVENANQALRSGLFAEADLVVDPQGVALIIPHAAIVEFAGAEKVWKVTDGVAVEQEVLTGQRRPEGIEILSGLVAGDVILHDGRQGGVARIKPIRAASAADAAEQSEELTERAGEPDQTAAPHPTVSG